MKAFASISLGLILVACSGGTGPEGTWTSGCIGTLQNAAGGAPTDPPVVFTLVFQSNQAVSIVESFDAAGCAGAVGTHTEFHSNFVVSGSSGTISGAQNIDFTNTGSTMVQNTSSRVAYANSNSVCGVTNWVLSQPLTIAGLSCSNYNIAQTDNPPAGTVSYNIFQVNGNRLCLGQTAPGSTPAGRPTVLATTDCYSKQ